MKRKRLLIGIIMIIVGMVIAIGSAIASIIFRWNNPDMTEMRQFLENPGPTIMAVIGYVIVYTGAVAVKYD